jgi:hypothetical protein
VQSHHREDQDLLNTYSCMFIIALKKLIPYLFLL